MVEALQGVDVLTGPQLIRNAVEVAEQLPDLKLMQITSAGYDEFNFGGPDVLEGLRQNDVIFANNGGSNAVGVAETTVMLMLAVCKNMFELALMTRQGKWTAHHSTLGVRGRHGARELSSQTVGIVGFGNIGRMVGASEPPTWPPAPTAALSDTRARLQRGTSRGSGARFCTTTSQS